MYKDLVFDSLSDLVLDFKQSYEKWWHTLQKARIGSFGPASAATLTMSCPPNPFASDSQRTAVRARCVEHRLSVLALLLGHSVQASVGTLCKDARRVCGWVESVSAESQGADPR
eukprot:59323-Chlamydomonas_euryale.AAC.1